MSLKSQTIAKSSHVSNKIPSLDGWRAIAILIVFLSHAGLGQLIPGGLGVTIFFFLSGYLITTLISEEFDRNNEVSIKKFYIRRLFRLTPPLLITLMLVYFLVHIGLLNGGISFQGFFAQMFYFANYYALFFDPGNTTPAGTGVFWSLAVEEHFYFIFPFVFAGLYKSNNKRPLIFVLIFLCVLALLWRYYLISFLHVHENRTYYATDTRMDSIIYGCLLALIKNPKGIDSALFKASIKDYLIFGNALILLALTVLIRNPTFRETVRYSLQGIALAPLFYYSIVLSRKAIFQPLNWGWVQIIGKYSYSIYLLHYILISNMTKITNNSAINGMLAAVLAIFYAVFIDRYIDEYGRNIRERYR